MARDRQTIITLGKLLYGDRWKSSFARMAEVSRPYVTMIAKGKRPLTGKLEAAIIEGLLGEIQHHRERAMEIKNLLQKYRNGTL